MIVNRFRFAWLTFRLVGLVGKCIVLGEWHLGLPAYVQRDRAERLSKKIVELLNTEIVIVRVPALLMALESVYRRQFTEETSHDEGQIGLRSLRTASATRNSTRLPGSREEEQHD